MGNTMDRWLHGSNEHWGGIGSMWYLPGSRAKSHWGSRGSGRINRKALRIYRQYCGPNTCYTIASNTTADGCI